LLFSIADTNSFGEEDTTGESNSVQVVIINVIE